jgi:hypothetical protein
LGHEHKPVIGKMRHHVMRFFNVHKKSLSSLISSADSLRIGERKAKHHETPSRATATSGPRNQVTIEDDLKAF